MRFFDPLLLPLPFTLLCLVLGALVGSFLNVVIYRLPKMMEREWDAQCAQWRDEPQPELPVFNLALPRSHCPACGHTLAIWENLPVVSFALLRGRCKQCGAGISLRYPTVEALTAVLFGLAGWLLGPSWATAGALVFLACMVALTFIDLDTCYLPDSLTLPLLWLGLAANISGSYTDLNSAVLGAIGGYGLLWSVYWGFKLATGKEGMGYGDFKLLAAIGAWLGWQVLPMVVLLSSILGTAVGLTLVALGRHQRTQPIPFGPYLAAAGVLALFVGRELTERFFGF